MANRGLNINIESVFVGLRRAWHPPSAAVEASFTNHAKTLDHIFGILRDDPDLAPLHSEIYQDFPAAKMSAPVSKAGDSDKQTNFGQAASNAITRQLSTPDERLRKGFYFCNSLIQLMESVYLDLRLEQDYRHPDNRGWMNLFRHWSRSDTFRITWAISASTYGLRFQNFCSRRLSLSLGVTDLKSVWDKEFSHLKNENHPLDAPDAKQFDHIETRLLEMLTSPHVRGVPNSLADNVEQVLLARLLVPSNRTAEIQGIGTRALTPEEREDVLTINFGIVTITGSIKKSCGMLSMIAVRRHLRDQGLGRQMMRDLICRLGIKDVALPKQTDLRRIGIPSGSGERIQDLFRSVCNEVDLSELRRNKKCVKQAQTDAKNSRPGAIFDYIPLLPYSGVVRPPGVTWVHAVGFCFWVLAGAGGIEPEEEEATKEALSDWAGDQVAYKETESVAIESRSWYESAKRPVEALKPEVETIVKHLREQCWFRKDTGYYTRAVAALEKISDSYDEGSETKPSEFEDELAAWIKKHLEPKPLTVDEDPEPGPPDIA